MTDLEKDLKRLIAKVADGQSLNEAEAAEAFDIIMSGEATPSQIGGFLMALRVNGETVEEITGAARIMRAKMKAVEAPEGAIDVVGTGGDGVGTQNISTATALVVAGCGVPVAKHGNRAASSKSGAADVLSELGINLDADTVTVQHAIQKAGIGFMLAPIYHSAMRYVGPVRVEMGVRTIFNILGPLANPASVKRLLVGTFDRRWIEPMAKVLGNLGAERAWVVHGSDGLDELTTTGPSYVAELKNGKVLAKEISPRDVGLPFASLNDLKGGTPSENAGAIRELLDGRKGAFRDIVLYGAAAALYISGKTPELADGVAIAASAIDDGKAADCLAKLATITSGS
ncbi:MAG: Anthranilate phosphoribosyltransferase [Alphaproteobacteria bacterium MarineAlpha4_Bin2]|nr:MAG: Anthranilate phosphoribosyltransferase [Alphaproteobacteria bacterium MarineAlpha4_Bin2]